LITPLRPALHQIASRVRGREAQILSYSYNYLSRLSSSTFHNYSDAGVISGTNNYNENLTYDLRGNIQTLQRTGFYTNGSTCTYGQIDNLTYSYTANTNRLHKVLDGTLTAGDAKSRGFNGLLSTVDNSMTYDRNGNLNKNLHKNVSTITYNHLNLPTVITFTTGNTIEFLYDAAGTKLRKTVKVGATVQYIQDYLPGGIEYRQTGTGVKRIESVFHAEGRYYNTNVDVSSTISWRKEYNFKDHLGNTRLVFTDRNANGVVDITGTASTSDVLQENHYYAFGLAFEGPWLQNDATARDNAYQYNGKELNSDFGLGWNDYGARWYDPSVGRWNAPDPHSDNYRPFSPYNYILNSPLNVIDPDGNDIYLLIWFSKNGETGHAGIAIENYKTVVKKDKDGKPILDRNGKPVKEQVKDGTFTYYDLWPNKSVESDEFQSNVESDYSGGVKINSLADLKMKDPTTHRSGQVDPEGRAADGMVRLTTSFEQDEAAKKAAVTDISNFRDYNACKNNCSTFAQRLINAAIEPNISASQLVKPPIALTTLYGYKDVNVVAPNNLYNAALKVKGAQRIKGPKQAEAKPYLEYFGKSNRR
jgi:RHS repeat-associated protein